LVIGEGQSAVVARGQRAKAAVLLMATRATGDLGHLGRRQAPLAHPIELAERGKRYMGYVEVEAHADGIGRDDVIDLSRLEQFDLPVARFRAERAHYNRRTATEAPQHFGHRVDL